jgi:hypothetical protein
MITSTSDYIKRLILSQENEADADSAFEEIANFIGAQREQISE